MILSLDGLFKKFGAVTVTDDLSFSLAEGEALGILGPNGAGKSTMFNLITGDIKPSAGTISYQGNNIGVLPPHKRCQLGIGRSYQIPQPFTQMTVF